MKRDIVHIDQQKCNGCGQCVPACHEGAITIIDGKACLSSEALCDGLGACLGHCPQGAITVEHREAAAFDELQVLPLHKKEPVPCACPGSMAREFGHQSFEGAGHRPSALRQWPVQLRLINPSSSFFKDADIVVAADCSAFAHGDFHRRFLKEKVLIIFCPKLDQDLEGHAGKLTEILRLNNIRSLTVVRMEVPCCGGTLQIVEQALHRSGKNVLVKEYTLALTGEII